MNIESAYNKLLNTSGYFFVYDSQKDDTYDCDSEYFKTWASATVNLVPGSFNPLHNTHKEIHRLSHKENSLTFFELSIERVSKGILSLEELEQRMSQFKNYASVIVSKEPRFITKIGVYKTKIANLKFHVGIDTLTRMADDYGAYGVQGLNANFVVYDRIINDKKLSLESEFENHIPGNCIASHIKRSKKSMKLSSTEIRKKSV